MRSKELSNCRKAAEQSALVGPNSSWRNWRKNRARISSNEVKVASPGEITKPNRLMTSARATGETGTTSEGQIRIMLAMERKKFRSLRMKANHTPAADVRYWAEQRKTFARTEFFRV
jgi:hypothetical protein